jgi:hypothetical protein
LYRQDYRNHLTALTQSCAGQGDQIAAFVRENKDAIVSKPELNSGQKSNKRQSIRAGARTEDGVSAQRVA